MSEFKEFLTFSLEDIISEFPDPRKRAYALCTTLAGGWETIPESLFKTYAGTSQLLDENEIFLIDTQAYIQGMGLFTVFCDCDISGDNCIRLAIEFNEWYNRGWQEYAYVASGGYAKVRSDIISLREALNII